MKVAFCAVFAVVFITTPASADQVHFTGETTADASLIKDTLQNIMRYAYAAQGCSAFGAVEASVLPASYKPKDSSTRPEKGKGTYESWTATLCGKPTKLLITFWPADDGGTMFAVGFPYPADAP